MARHCVSAAVANPAMSSVTTTRSEFLTLTRLAAPLAATQLLQMGMGIVDTVMAGRLSAADLAGVALAGSVMWPVMMLMMGTLQAVTPTVSQLHGAGRAGEAGEVVRQALYLALVAAAIIILAVSNAENWYALAGTDPEAVAVSVPYLQAHAWGIPAGTLYFVLRYLAEGMGHTRPALIIVICALIAKVPLNFIFMHGLFGMPALGGVGCGVATAILLWLQLALMVLIITRRRFAVAGLLERFSRPDPSMLMRLLRIGVPIGATSFFEVTMFSITTLFMGTLGAQTVAAHVIAMNLGGVAFMVPMAYGMAGTIRVGYNVGARDLAGARRTAMIEMVCALALAGTTAVLIMTFREFFASLYTNDLEVLGLAVSLMLFVALFQFFDGMQAVTIGVLRGYKDTRMPMFMTFFGYWGVGLPLGASLGFGWFAEPMGVYGFWIGLTTGLIVVAAMTTIRLLRVSRSEDTVLRFASR